MIFGGCSTQPVDDSGFWANLRVGALEKDPPATLADLVDRAEVIFTGKVTSIELGPSSLPDNAGGPVIQTVALEAKANSVMKGNLDGGKDVRIIMVPAVPVDVTLKGTPSGNQAIFFLVPTSPSGYYACVSLSGLIEETPSGLMTVVDPVQSGIATSGQGTAHKSFNNLVKEVRELLK